MNPPQQNEDALEEHATAVVLLKCKRGQEGEVAKALSRLRDGSKCEGCCYFQNNPLPAGDDGKRHCRGVRISDAAFSFGPFDFIVMLQAADVGDIEGFVVYCLRASPDVVLDTQTLVGIPLRRDKV
jgi:hypothetical protein